MPIYRYKCPDCGKKIGKFLSSSKSKLPQTCKCGSMLERDAQGFTTIKETIDNGIMPKRSEQLANSPELIAERKQRGKEEKQKNTL